MAETLGIVFHTISLFLVNSGKFTYYIPILFLARIEMRPNS